MAQIDVVRRVLASKLGKVLTPQDAAEIEDAIFFSPDLSHNPAKFGELAYGEYTIRAERLSDILPELHKLHEEHWLETERHRHGFALNPDYEGMCAREKAGRLIQFTMRSKDGELVGNLRMLISTSMHTQTVFSSEDTLFIRPGHRGSFAVMALIRFAEQSLLALGVREIRVNSKVVNRADVLMRRMGYLQVAIEFVKIFKD